MSAFTSVVRPVCVSGGVAASSRRQINGNRRSLIQLDLRRHNNNNNRGSILIASAAEASSSENEEGLYRGTVFFHLYPELSDPKPIFNTFLEGALHCCEVAKSHPNYATAHFHEAWDQEDAINCRPHAYFNMALFSCPPTELYSAFEDYKECLDIGHMDQQHHPMPCREVACSPGPGSAIASAPHGSVRYTETDAVVLTAVPRGHKFDIATWREWSGADAAMTLASDTFLESTLFECVDEKSKYSHVIRTEIGGVEDDATVAAAVTAAREGIIAAATKGEGDAALIGAYRCAFNIEKTGAPAGALPAVREMGKKKAENEEETKSRLATDGKSGTV